ncbi:MAG: hypothetical protein HZA08_08790 [Nitrospirae bacterium]|nr:hypothetical protein [Nitrospirota bacterium]
MIHPFDKSSIENISGNRFIGGNTVTLLYKGSESFECIFSSIEKAQDFISLQFYIFRNDETGRELAGLLKKKVQEGIKVFILYDHFGSFWTPQGFWKELAGAGIRIRVSRPFVWSSPLHYPHRDHRKLIIIDGIKAFTGGFNIGNEYSGLYLRKRGKAWRDTGIMLEGQVASELFKTFQMTWQAMGGRHLILQKLLHKPLPELFKDTLPLPSSNPYESNGLPVIPIFASSSRGRRKLRKLLYYSIHNAKESILLTTAYFIPSRRMLDSLEEAVNRGVNVKLLLAGRSDVAAAHYAGRSFYERLLNRGIKIYNYQGEVLHAKSYVFDGCWSIVGSANLDFLSLRRNDEGNVGILDEDFSKRMKCVFEEDIESSIEIKEETWKKRPLSDRLKERFFVMFRRRL